ncbi:Delta(6)-protoilludene synthase [Lachnellula suecica]|uniref:Terpene synthase n=1 Tax=Lachnellula suecica TaxID=602035 RepID=A0A8T9CGP1_9HELO|nr:Delta(6)-protoilludene synthase [Lachnellula suecica]
MTHEIFLPDLEAGWKWPRRISPYIPEIRQECLDWVASFKAFTPEAQKAFDRCNFNLLTGLSYPWLTKDQLRCACELMNLFFLFDEHSDKSDASEVWNQVGVIMDAFRNPDKARPQDEWIGGEVARQFWSRTIQISTPTFQRRFLESWEEYLQGTAQQAEDRCSSHIRNVTSYLEIRRRTIGARPSFNILEMDMNVPDEVMGHPTIRELESLATDLTIIANDILSYNKEQASGDDEHNLITIAMKEHNTDVQGAINWTAKLHAEMVRRFNKLYLQIPRWGGPLDMDIQTYVNGMAQWVGANVQWSYESERYFGKRGLEIKKTKVLCLLPKTATEGGKIGPVVVDDASL